MIDVRHDMYDLTKFFDNAKTPVKSAYLAILPQEISRTQ